MNTTKMDVYIKCYYPIEHRHYLVSSKVSTLAWDFLIQDSTFRDFLNKSRTKISMGPGQIIEKLYVDIFYKEEEMAVALDYYSKEGSSYKTKTDYFIQFDDIKKSAIVARKGYKVKAAIDEERQRVYKRCNGYCLLIIFCALAIIIILLANVKNNLGLLVVLFPFTWLSYYITINLYSWLLRWILPKDNEAKVSIPNETFIEEYNNYSIV